MSTETTIDNKPNAQLDLALVATQGMDAPLRKLVAQACQLARLRAVIWEQKADGGWPDVNDPAIAIGYLPTGSRKVPDSLAFTISRAFPGLPLILMAEEHLTRDVVLLNGGRVTLVSPGLSAERIADRIRKVLVPNGIGTGPMFTRRLARMAHGIRWWAISLTRFPSTRDCSAMETTFPWFRPPFEAAKTFQGVISARGAAEEVIVCSNFAERLRTNSEGEWPKDMLAMHVESAARRACVAVAPSAGSAWLLSPNRLPRAWDLNRHARQPVHQFETHVGDIILLHSDPAWQPPKVAGGLMCGVDLFEHLQQELFETTNPTAVILYEVR